VVCLVTSDAKGAYEPLYDIDPHTGATIEIFYADPTLAASFGANAGWYWRSCQRGNRPGLLRDNLDENGASIWMRRSGRAGR
jgi:hypothetical protein